MVSMMKTTKLKASFMYWKEKYLLTDLLGNVCYRGQTESSKTLKSMCTIICNHSSCGNFGSRSSMTGTNNSGLTLVNPANSPNKKV